MSAFIKFNSTRPNTNADFWWTTSDPAITAMRDQVTALAQQANIPYEVVIAPDSLSLTAQFTTESREQWQNFVGALSSAIPTLISSRADYFQANGHTLTVQTVNGYTGDVVKQVNVIS